MIMMMYMIFASFYQLIYSIYQMDPYHNGSDTYGQR